MSLISSSPRDSVRGWGGESHRSLTVRLSATTTKEEEEEDEDEEEEGEEGGGRGEEINMSD